MKNMEDLLIRDYHPDDEEEVVDLWLECDLVTPQNNPRRDIERKLAVNPEWFLVGIFEGKVLATCMAGYEGHRGWINYLAVSPLHRRQGIATLMMAQAESRLRTAGCPKINLQIRETNAEVIKFYKSIGYAEDLVVSMGKRLVNDERYRVEPVKAADADKPRR
jgi:ribosomal protein S18 acetylase RimI-like enzyme